MPWWQLAACIAKNDSAKLWFFWLSSNVQTVSWQTIIVLLPQTVLSGLFLFLY